MKVRQGTLRALFLIFLSLVAAPAMGAGSRPELERWSAAADDFDRLAAVASREGRLPRLSDADAAPLLRILTDSGSAFAGPPFEPGDLDQLIGVQQRAVGIFFLYIEFGVDPALPKATQELRNDRNVTLYQNELAPLIAFMADATAEFLPAVAAGVAGTPPAERTAEWLQQARSRRDGLATMLRGMIQMAPIPSLTPDNRLLVMNALARNAPTFAASLSLSQRRSMIGSANAVKPRAGPQARMALERLIAALSTTSCEAVCAI